jgi:hypothetical protein
MYNIVYIDEKWFYRTRRNQKYYLANDEERPQRAVKSKNFIEKVMVLTVVARPRFDEHGVLKNFLCVRWKFTIKH